MSHSTPDTPSFDPEPGMVHLVPRREPLASLPRILSPFIGREREITAVQEMLLRPEFPLVTLIGPAGVGKTRLAVRTAEKVGDAFAHGTAFISMAAVHDPELVFPTIVAALGVRIGTERSLLDRLAVFLDAGPFLLVLDNLEQVPAAAPRIAELLVACPRLTILATSRSPLHVSGERIFAVPPLTLPIASGRSAGSPTLAELTRAEAVRLFVERAQAAHTTFALTEANAASVAAICRQLDGLPLAIELAAARVGALPPAALLARLEHRLPLLVGGPEDAPRRLQTMRDAIAWSYGLLSEEEQALFQQLAVFVGGFTIEAAEAIVGARDQAAGNVVDGIVSLVEKSLIQQIEESDGEPRYTMLEVIREFGLEYLEESGVADATYDRLLSWYLARALAGEWRWDVPTGNKDGAWFATWEREHANLQAVLAWTETRDKVERGLELASALFLFWWARQHLAEGRDLLERGLARRTGVAPPVQAHALAVLSALAHRQDDNVRAAEVAREAVSLWTEIGDDNGLGHARYLLGIALYRQGDYDAAEQCYSEALMQLGAVHNEVLGSEALLGLALIARDRGDLARAASLFDEALTWQSRAEANWGAALSRHGYATVVQAQGDIARALGLYRESLHYWRQIGDEGSVAVCLEGIASALCVARLAAQAARLLGAAHALREAIDYPVPCNALASYGGLVRSVRDCLGVDAFAKAWLAGLRLSIDEAIAEAFPPLAALRTEDQRASIQRPAERSSLTLTPREQEVLKLVANGHSDREIAAALFISRRTASEHVGKILQKLDARSRADAAALAVRAGLV